MGQNGEQLVNEDGTFGIHSDAKRILFDSTNTTCCCDEPPDPPTGKPCPDVFNFSNIRLPNTAKVSLGYSWASTEAIATRQDNVYSIETNTVVNSTSIYWVTIGAVKTGDQEYGTRTVLEKNNDGSAGSHSENWSEVANDLNTLKDGKRYHLGIMIHFGADRTIQADVFLLPFRNNPTTKYYGFGETLPSLNGTYFASSDHPVGLYDFTFLTDRSTLHRSRALTLTTSDKSELIQHDMSMFNFTLDLGNGTSDAKTPEGGSLCWRDHRCRKPYHAASGTNAYSGSKSSDGKSRLEEPWMYIGTGALLSSPFINNTLRLFPKKRASNSTRSLHPLLFKRRVFRL